MSKQSEQVLESNRSYGLMNTKIVSEDVCVVV